MSVHRPWELDVYCEPLCRVHLLTPDVMDGERGGSYLFQVPRVGNVFIDIDSGWFSLHGRRNVYQDADPNRLSIVYSADVRENVSLSGGNVYSKIVRFLEREIETRAYRVGNFASHGSSRFLLRAGSFSLENFQMFIDAKIGDF